MKPAHSSLGLLLIFCFLSPSCAGVQRHGPAQFLTKTPAGVVGVVGVVGVGDVSQFGSGAEGVTIAVRDPLTRQTQQLTLLPAAAVGHWTAAGISLVAVESQSPGRKTVQYTLHNASITHQEVVGIRCTLPTITGPPVGSRLFVGTYGGQELDISAAGFRQTSVYPGACFSPIACVYDAKGTGWAIAYFDASLAPASLGFYGNQAGLWGYVQVSPTIAPGGGSQSFTISFLQLSGLPDSALAMHRNQEILPFMAALGIPEAPSPGWQSPIGNAETAHSLQANLDAAADQGFHGFFQWSWPWGKNPLTGDFYFTEPDPSHTQQWMIDAATAQIQIPPGLFLGVDLDPSHGPSCFASMPAGALPLPWADVPRGSLPLDLADADGWAYVTSLADQLRAAHVTAAFWDSGEIRGAQSLRLLQLFRSRGVVLLPEAGSSDLGAWVTGGSFNRFMDGWADPTTWSSSQTNAAARVVTPSAALLWFQHNDVSLTPAVESALAKNGYVVCKKVKLP